ncbi:UNVERIFIED_ORG: hypothetical protein ABIB52_004644 [Arthrobacter sp. UYCu721]
MSAVGPPVFPKDTEMTETVSRGLAHTGGRQFIVTTVPFGEAFWDER